MSNSLTTADLVAYHLTGVRPRSELVIGIEVEKTACRIANGRVPTFDGAHGYRAILETLVRDLGWRIIKRVNGHPYLIQRGETIISLEVSGTLEFAGTTHRSLHDLTREFRLHVNELREISAMHGIRWLGLGIQPTSHLRAHGMICSDRFHALVAYFRRRSPKYGETWLKKTSSVQVNFDFTSRVNLERKFHLLTRFAPVLAALFSNSAISDGETNGLLSHRLDAALRADPPRYDPPQNFFEKTFSIEIFVEYALDMPMLFIERGEKTIPIRGRTFRQFMTKGYAGERATLADYALHISFIYTDVRLKRYIEFRPVDSLPPALVPAVPAIVKGLMYDHRGWDFIREITQKWTYTDYRAFRAEIVAKGLQATIRGISALELAKLALDEATRNLRRLGRTDFAGRDESIYLEPIKEFVFVREQSPAEWTAERWRTDWHGSIGPLIEWAGY